MTETKWLSEEELRGHKWFVQRPKVLDEILKSIPKKMYLFPLILFTFLILFFSVYFDGALDKATTRRWEG